MRRLYQPPRPPQAAAGSLPESVKFPPEQRQRADSNSFSWKALQMFAVKRQDIDVGNAKQSRSISYMKPSARATRPKRPRAPFKAVPPWWGHHHQRQQQKNVWLLRSVPHGTCRRLFHRFRSLEFRCRENGLMEADELQWPWKEAAPNILVWCNGTATASPQQEQICCFQLHKNFPPGLFWMTDFLKWFDGSLVVLFFQSLWPELM